MTFKPGEKVFSGWKVDTTVYSSAKIKIFALKSLSLSNDLGSMMMVIDLESKDEVDRFEESMCFLQKNRRQGGLLEIYEWKVDSIQSKDWGIVRTEACSPVSFLRLSSEQCINMLNDLLDAASIYDKNFIFMEGINKYNVFLSDDGRFKFGGLLPDDKPNQIVRLNQSLSELAALADNLYDYSSAKNPSFEKLISQAKNYRFIDANDFKKAIETVKSEQSQAKLKDRFKRLRRISYSALAVFLCAFSGVYFLSHQSEQRQKDAQIQSYSDSYNSIGQDHELNVTNGWENVISEENHKEFTKDLNGARMTFIKSFSSISILIQDIQAEFNHGQIKNEFDDIDPKLMKTGFLHHFEKSNQIQASPEVFSWLADQGVMNINEEGTEKSWKYSNEDFYMAFHHDILDNQTKYIISDYKSSMVMNTQYNENAQVEQYVLNLFKNDI